MKFHSIKIYIKRVLSSSIGVLIFLSAPVSAENIGVCTHMAHAHTGNAISRVLDKVEELNCEYIRDELRWGWGMQASETAELQMPATGGWVDEAKNRDVDSLVILGLGNSVFADDEGELPTVENENYLNKYLEYVRFVVKNCKGKASAYEIWNEPNHGPFNYQIANGIEYNPSDYVKLVAAVSDVIKSEYSGDEKQPKIVGGAHLFGGTKDKGWIEGLFESGIGNYIDAFSIHVYTHKYYPEKKMETDAYNRAEKVMKDNGFDGELWVTETGYSTADTTQEEQAAWSIRTKVLWDNFLNKNNRAGKFFWYDLRNDGTDASARENNYGLIDYAYSPKLSFNSVKLYNTLLKDRKFYELISAGSYSADTFKNEAKYIDETTGDYTYILYKGKSCIDTQTSVKLSGNIAYLYDYQGNILKTYNDTNQTVTVDLSENPKFIHCVTYKTSIDELNYDADKNVCTISGQTNLADGELTVSLFENERAVQSEKAKIENGEYKIKFSVNKDGVYKIRAGKEELDNLNSTFVGERDFAPKRKVDNKPENIEYGISAAYDSGTSEVSLCGRLVNSSGEAADGILNILVLNDGDDIQSLKAEDIVYMDDVAVSGGEFTTRFKVKDSTSKKYRLYLRTECSEKEFYSFGNSANGRYVYALDFSESPDEIRFELSLHPTESSVMLIGQFDKYGRLVKISTKEVKANEGKVALNEKKHPDAVSYIAYLWDNMTSMKPIIPMNKLK